MLVLHYSGDGNIANCTANIEIHKNTVTVLLLAVQMVGTPLYYSKFVNISLTD